VPRAERAQGDAPPPDHSWNDGSGPNFKVRSQFYKKTQLKEPSGVALFELIHLDIYKTPCRIAHVGAWALT
jgi:hypothetical protein